MPWVPANDKTDPRHNFDYVPEPLWERLFAGGVSLVAICAVLLVALAVLVWAWRVVF